MKKFISIIIALSMLLVMCAPALAVESEEIIHHNFYGDNYTDENGNMIESVITETDTQLFVEIYVNGVLESTTVSNKETWNATVISYEGGSAYSSTSCNLHDYVDVITTTSAGIAPASAIVTSRTYNIANTYRTDYSYHGSILYADTLTAAYEISTSNRHNETILNFSQGDAVGLVLAALISAFGGNFSVGVVAAIGIPIIGSKLADGIFRSVWMTDFKVSTKVYFDNIYTGLISQTYNEVLVSEMTDANNVKHTYYSDDMYGYDLIWSQSSHAASGCAPAFAAKYINLSNPNLMLPITNLPFYG